MDVLAELKFWGTLGMLAAALALLAWLGQHERAAGKKEVEAAVQAALTEAQKQEAAHVAAVRQELGGVADALRAERDAALAHRDDPQPDVRVSVDPVRPRPVPCTSTSAGRDPLPPPAAGSLPAVPEGAGSGPDIGPGLHELALAGDLVLALARASQSSSRTLDRP